MTRDVLTRPDGTDPDGFSRRVAEAYRELVIKTAKPAVAMAEEAGAPVATVHRWIAEARRRGHLPPARQGRAGIDPYLLVANELGVSVERLRDAVDRCTRSGLRK